MERARLGLAKSCPGSEKYYQTVELQPPEVTKTSIWAIFRVKIGFVYLKIRKITIFQIPKAFYWVATSRIFVCGFLGLT